MSSPLPTYFLSDRVGLPPFMRRFDDLFDGLEASRRDIHQRLGAQPHGVLLISGGWEVRGFASASAMPSTSNNPSGRGQWHG